MRGSLGASRRVATLLADPTAGVPARLRVVERELDLPGRWLPDPALVTHVEPAELSLEQYPALVCSVLSTTGAVVDDLDTYGDPDGPAWSAGSAEGWAITYRCRVEVFCIGDDVETADVLRAAYLLAVRETLLEHRDVPDDLADAVAAGDVAPAPAVIAGFEPLFAEAFDTVARGESRAYSQALLDFPLTVTEVLSGEPGVPVEAITVTPAVLGLADPVPGWHPSD